MAHFAKLDDNNVVTKIFVIDDNHLINPWTGDPEEILGIAHCKINYGGGNWKQTCCDGTIRKCYAGIGMVYNEELDAFIDPQPFPSWVLDEETATWISPLGPAPVLTEEQQISNSSYRWDEDVYQADNTSGWIFVTP